MKKKDWWIALAVAFFSLACFLLVKLMELVK